MQPKTIRGHYALFYTIQIVILVVIQPATLSLTTNLEEKVVSRTKIL